MKRCYKSGTTDGNESEFGARQTLQKTCRGSIPIHASKNQQGKIRKVCAEHTCQYYKIILITTDRLSSVIRRTPGSSNVVKSKRPRAPTRTQPMRYQSPPGRFVTFDAHVLQKWDDIYNFSRADVAHVERRNTCKRRIRWENSEKRENQCARLIHQHERSIKINEHSTRNVDNSLLFKIYKRVVVDRSKVDRKINQKVKINDYYHSNESTVCGTLCSILAC